MSTEQRGSVRLFELHNRDHDNKATGLQAHLDNEDLITHEVLGSQRVIFEITPDDFVNVMIYEPNGDVKTYLVGKMNLQAELIKT